MSRRLKRLWLLLPLLLASQSWALGLGDIRLSSALNEPLRAEIELLAATAEDLDNLSVQLASAETFARYDLDRPLYLSRVRMRIVKSGGADGNVVRITSLDPITEPFITFLVEAVWPRGRLLREYTLLLDPPTFAPPPVTQSTQAVTAPTRAAQTDSGQIQRPAPQPPASPPAQQPVAPAPTQSAQAEQPAPSAPPDEPSVTLGQPDFDTRAGGDLIIRRGDTLWGIASRVRPDSRLTMNQTMLAIYEANPQAFAGNINVMSAGATLRIPSADEVFRISRGDALAEVRRQNAAWGGGTVDVDTQSQPALTLVPPDDDVDLFDDDVGQMADDEAVDEAVDDLISADEARINELEGVLADHQDSLIEISDNELAALRAELAELRGEEPPEPLPLDDVVDDTGIDDADDALADDAEPAAIDDDLLADDEVVDDSTPEVADTVPAPQVVAARPRDKSLIDTVIDTIKGYVDIILGYADSIWGIIGGALLLAIALLVWFARRAGRGDDEDSTGVWESLEQDDVDGGESLASTERLRALAKEDDDAIVVVEQETVPVADEDSMLDTFAATVVEVEPTAPEPEEDLLMDMDTAEVPIGMDMDTAEVPIGMDMDTAEVPIGEDMDTAEVPIGEAVQPEAGQDLMTDTAAFPATEAEPEVPQVEVVTDATLVPDSVEATSPNKALDDTFHSDTALNLDQADPVAEADFHMAYGLYDQAADLINGALEVESEREDLLAKLCEIYFVWGNRDAFIDAAGRLRAVVSDDENPDWDKIVIMGQQIASDHELFSGVSAAAATKAIDLSFEGGEEAGELDMNFEAAGDAEPAIDLSFEGVEEAAELDMNFDTSESDGAGGDIIDLGAGSDDDTAESPTIDASLQDATSEMPTAEGSSDTPTIEQQFAVLEATGESPVAPDDADATEIASLVDLDQADDIKTADMTAEIELHDLNLNLDGLEDTQIAGDDELDYQAQNLEDTAESQTVEADESLAATGEMPVLEDITDTNFAIPGEDTDVGIDASLLDATGQTQVLSEDKPIESASDAAAPLSDDDMTMRAPLDADESTVLTDASEFGIEHTEALPKESFSSDMSMDETGEVPSLAGSTNIDLDLDDLTGVLEVSEVGDTIDQGRDAPTVEQPVATQGDVDLDVGDAGAQDEDSPTREALAAGDSGLHEAPTMTEVGTKLDLARAYVDMGDPGGARNILEEVLDEGDEAQRQQAQQLLDSIPS